MLGFYPGHSAHAVEDLRPNFQAKWAFLLNPCVVSSMLNQRLLLMACEISKRRRAFAFLVYPSP
jgi:hypothetical protein